MDALATVIAEAACTRAGGGLPARARTVAFVDAVANPDQLRSENAAGVPNRGTG